MNRYGFPSLAALKGHTAVAALLLLGSAIANPALAGAQLKAVVKTGGSHAALVTFDPVTGENVGGAHLNTDGASYDFDRIGSITAAPDATIRGVVKTGGSHAALVTFDPATGENIGGTHLNTEGVSYDFDRIGSITYASDGTIRGVVKTGGSHAALVTFDPATGENIVGTHLNTGGVSYDFDRIGSMAYASDGTIRGVVKTGGSHAALVTFDGLTGENIGGVHLNDLGVSLDFSDVGSILFAPDGTFQALVRSAGNFAALATFDLATGTQISKTYLNVSGVNYDFDRLGSLIYVTLSDGVPGDVPEPASLALVICGLGAAGIAMRRRPVSRA
ncbi:PEP-CTERM sorting domain-containing protein [Sphingosinicella xenopeptidilytica]|uniref:PEP-CTERM sorting domain-containing protein n=1 Tax=Sphingosinicella xenopeptidilytica TaxID=364098 RepID=A0ABW3BZ29_SPHXN